MKDYYKISEISKLYGIGVDSLRYYERLGILSPHRDTNGYRLYNLNDIYKLNIIRDLRQLDFSMPQIKAYLDGQSVSHTLELLEQEQELMQAQILELQNKKELISERLATLRAAQKIHVGSITRKTLPERKCVRLNEHITRDEEMDFIIKKLHRVHENRIRDLGNQTIGAFWSEEELKKGVTTVYSSVFFTLEGADDCDFALPAGEYLSCFYRGGYEQNARRLQEFLEYMEEHKLTMMGSPFELYEIDNRDTMQKEEFLTEIQVMIAECE